MISTPRLPLIGDDTDDELVRSMFERTRAHHGRVPNLYRTLGHSAGMLDAWIGFAWTLRSDATTPRSVRELVIMRVASLLGSDYELVHHRPMAIAAGCSPAKLDALGGWRTRADLYAASERAAVAVAERIAVGAPIEPDEWSALRDHFDEAACVELTLTASFYVCVARMLDALAVPLEDEA